MAIGEDKNVLIPQYFCTNRVRLSMLTKSLLSS